MAPQLTFFAALQGPANPFATPAGRMPAQQGRAGLHRGMRMLGLQFRAAAYRPERHYMRGGRTPGCRSLGGG
jgi:hypothetical protein